MESVDVIVVGAGVGGLAVSRKLSIDGLQVVVVEKHDGFGRETSSRNSEVIHAGLYYPAGSLKGRLCVDGNRRFHEYCAQRSVPVKQCGKLVVAVTDAERAKVDRLFAQGTANGSPGLQLIDRAEITRLEPRVNAHYGLWSPSTGILDTHRLMAALERDAVDHGATVAYQCEAVAIDRTGGTWVVTVNDADGEPLKIETRVVVNAAGLYADKVAALAGIDIDSAGYRIHWCKGEYFRVSNRHRGILSHLVYPAPTNISLGVHSVLGIDGSLRLGPNAFYVDKCDYDVDPSHGSEFLQSARTFLPFLQEGDLAPDQAGIRPKLQTEEEAFRDFVICEESARGLGGLVNLIGIESPGLTSCLPIADLVASLVPQA